VSECGQPTWLEGAPGVRLEVHRGVPQWTAPADLPSIERFCVHPECTQNPTHTSHARAHPGCTPSFARLGKELATTSININYYKYLSKVGVGLRNRKSEVRIFPGAQSSSGESARGRALLGRARRPAQAKRTEPPSRSGPERQRRLIRLEIRRRATARVGGALAVGVGSTSWAGANR
jgi:hypothetical protein